MYSLWVLRTSSLLMPRLASVGTLQIVEQAVTSALTAETGLLVSPERRGRIELVVRVRPHHARLHPVRHPQDPRPLRRPNAGREAVRSVVGLLHRLLGSPETHDREDRAEDLLLGDAVGLGHASEQRGNEPEAA